MSMYINNYIHNKISENDDDNAAVQAANNAKQTAEALAEQSINRYRKHRQKKRIRKEYAQAVRAREAAANTAENTKKAAKKTGSLAKKATEFIKDHPKAVIIATVIGILFILIATCASSCGAMIASGVSAVSAGSYQSYPAELDAADAKMAERELMLQNRIDRIERDFPGYDEYNYEIEEIGHNPFTLINYLSAKYIDVIAANVEAEIESIFNQMYRLTVSSREEIRTRIVTGTRTVWDAVSRTEKQEEYEYEEEYTVRILDTVLTKQPMETVVAQRLSGDTQASDLYAAYQETSGALQQFYTPLDLDWQSSISSYYGHRKNPRTGANEFNRGVDIAVAEGTEVYASQDGTVTASGYDDYYGNYIIIEDAQGYVTKYAYLSSMKVGSGQTVRHGDTIGKTGSTGNSTGSQLHIECMYNGEYYNPLFYFENGNGSIYGTFDPTTGLTGDVAALFLEAEKYLGYPYVWGGSSPATSFDCSGYVSYVLTHSGYYNMPRTTAQGIYNKCMKIDASQAQPGDLVFFTKTYNSGNPVTHVGIYAGNGEMYHAGNPIKKSSIISPYWESHLYGFGRLR